MEELESSNGSIVGTIFVASCALVLSLSIALKHKREQYNRKSPLPQLRTNIHTMEFRDNSMPSDMHYKRGDRSKSLPYMRDTIFTVNEKAKQATLRERGITDSMTGNNKNGQGKDYARMHDKADEHRRLNYNYVCDFYYHSLLAQSHVRPQSAQLTEWQDETLGVSIPFSPILFSIASEERQAPLILLTFRYLRQEGHKITITIEKLAEPTSVEEYRDVSLSNISTCAEILSTSLARIGSAQRPQAEYCYTVDNEPNNSSISNSNNYTTMASSGTSALAHGISSTQSSHYYDSHNSMRTSEQQHMQNVHTNTCDHNNYMNNNINGYNNNSSSRTSQLAARSCKEQTRYALAVFVVFDTFAFTVQYVAPTRVRSILPTAFYELIRGIKVVDALPTTSYYLLTEPRLGLGIRLPLNFVITTNAMNLFYCDQNAAAEVGSKVKLLTGITRNEKEKSSQQQELKRYEENRREHVQLERQKKEMAKCAWSPLMIGASRGTSRIAFALKYEPPPHMKTAEEPSFTYTAQSALQHTIPWVQSSISRLSSSESESESESSSLESESTMSSTSFSSSSEQSQYSNYYSILEKYLTRQLYKSMNYFGLELLPSEECTCTSATSYARPVQTESKQKYQTSNTKSQIKPFTVAPDAEVSNNNNDDTIGIVALRRWPVSAVRKWNEITLAHGNKQNDSVLGNNNNNNRVASSFFFRRSVSNATVRQKECDNDKAVATSHNEYNNNSNNSNNAKKDCKRVESVTTNSQLQQEQEKEKIQELADEIQTKTQTAVAAVPSNGKQNTTTNLRINKKNYYNKVKSIRHNRTKFRVHVKRANDNNKNNNISYKVQNGFAMNTNNNGEAKERAMKETIQSDNTINIDARLYELSICKNGNFGAEYDDDDEYNNNNNDDSSNTYSVDLYKSMNGEVTHSQLHRSNSYAAHSSSWSTQQAYFCVNYVYVQSTASIAHLLVQHPLDSSSTASTSTNANYLNTKNNNNINNNNNTTEKQKDNTNNVLPEEPLCKAIYVAFYVPVAPSEWASFHFLAAEQRHTVKEVISFATSVMRSLTLGNHYGQEPCVLYCNIRQRVMPFTIPLSSHWSCVDENIIDDPFALIRIRENDNNNYKSIMQRGPLHDCKNVNDTIVIVRPFPLTMIKVKAANAQRNKRKVNAKREEVRKNIVETSNSSFFARQYNVSRNYYTNDEQKLNNKSQYHSYQRRIAREVKKLLELYVNSLSEEMFVNVLSCKSKLLANGSVAVIMVFGPPSYASRNASFAASQCKSEWSTSFTSHSSYTSSPASSPVVQNTEISYNNNNNTKATTTNGLCTNPSVSSLQTDNYTPFPENSMESHGQLTNEQLWEQQEQHLLESQKLEEVTGSFNPLASYEPLHEYYTHCHTRAMQEASLTVPNNNNNNSNTMPNTMERKQEGSLSTSNVYYFPRTFTETDCVLESDHDCRISNSCVDKPIRIAIVVCSAHLTDSDGGGSNNNTTSSTCLSQTSTHAVPKALLFMAQTSIVNFHKTRNALMKLVTQVKHLRSQTME